MMGNRKRMKQVRNANVNLSVSIFPVLVLAILISLLAASVSCDPKYTKTEPSESFNRIYNKPDQTTYTAVDMKQLSDGGYVILGEAEGKPYLLRIDKEGNFLWDLGPDPEAGYEEPIADILVFGSEFYFFCTQETGQFRRIVLLTVVETNLEPGDIEAVEFPGYLLKYDFIIPMAAKLTPDGSLLVLGLNAEDNEVIMQKVGRDVSLEWGLDYSFHFVCANEYPVTEKRYHILASGESGYKFQSYLDSAIDSYPSCFGIADIDPSDGSAGTAYVPANPFLAAEWSGGNAAGALLENESIYFFVNTPVESVTPQTSIRQFELNASKAISVKIMNVNQQKIAFFTGSAKNDKIVLFVFDWSTGTAVPINKEYFGHTNIYEAAGLIETEDGGLAILGTTYISGRLGRICVFKLSKAELEELAGQF